MLNVPAPVLSPGVAMTCKQDQRSGRAVGAWPELIQ